MQLGRKSPQLQPACVQPRSCGWVESTWDTCARPGGGSEESCSTGKGWSSQEIMQSCWQETKALAFHYLKISLGALLRTWWCWSRIEGMYQNELHSVYRLWTQTWTKTHVHAVCWEGPEQCSSRRGQGSEEMARAYSEREDHKANAAR